MQAIDRESFKGWGMYLKLAFPALIMLCADWWSLEILTVIAGTVGVEEQAAMGTAFAIIYVSWMIIAGFSDAVCAIIGNCIGANNVALAKRFFSMITTITVMTTIATSMMTYVFRDDITAIFAEDPKVRVIVSQLLLVVLINFFFDGMQGYF